MITRWTEARPRWRLLIDDRSSEFVDENAAVGAYERIRETNQFTNLVLLNPRGEQLARARRRE